MGMGKEHGQEEVDPTYYALPPAAEEEEEEKMNKFYELLRGFRQVRDYLQKRLYQLNTASAAHHHHHHHRYKMACDYDPPNSERQETEKEKRSKDEDEEDEPSWVPCFKWEDFNHAHHQPPIKGDDGIEIDDHPMPATGREGSNKKRRKLIIAVNKEEVGQCECECDDKDGGNHHNRVQLLDLNLMPL